MIKSKIENQYRITNIELNRRIQILEEMLLKSDSVSSLLQDSEKRYRRLFESSRDGLFIINANTGQLLDINPFLMALLDYSYEELKGKCIWEIGAFKDITKSKKDFESLKDQEYIRSEDLQLETRSGKIVTVEFVSNVYLVDNEKVIQCNIRDISQRKRDEEERNRLLLAIEQTGESIVISNAQGIIEFVNPAFERITGYTREEVIGRNLNILNSGKQNKLFYRNLWDTISRGKIWTGRLINKRKDGALYTEDATISPVRNSSGQIINYVAVKRDITERLQLEIQYQQSQKMESIGTLAAGIAHDFNNVLSPLIGYVEVLKEDLPLDSPLQEYVKEVLVAALRLRDLVRRILDFSCKSDMEMEPMILEPVIKEVVELLRSSIPTSIDIQCDINTKESIVIANSTQIHQVVMNLLTNASHAMENNNGQLIVTLKEVRIEPCQTILLDLVPGLYADLTVKDTGVGIDKHVLDKVFEPYYSTKEKSKGTGLGLSVVLGIVKSCKGDISIESEIRKGTAVHVYLPLIDQS